MDGRKIMNSRERGVSTVEYLVGTAVMIAALFLPVPGMEGESVVTMMVEAFKDNHHRYIWSMSYPL